MINKLSEPVFGAATSNPDTFRHAATGHRVPRISQSIRHDCGGGSEAAPHSGRLSKDGFRSGGDQYGPQPMMVNV